MSKTSLIIPLGLGFSLVLFLSKSSSAASNTTTSTGDDAPTGPSDFIRLYSSFANSTQSNYAVPALFTLSQGGLESNWGASNLARNSNNLFSIKADSKWYGPVYTNSRGEKYRKYSSVQDSFNDQAKFLTLNPRYDSAFLTNDPYDFAVKVAAAGYAEDPDYLSKIKRTMNSVSQLMA